MPIVFISIIYCKNCLLQFVEAEGMHAGHKSPAQPFPILNFYFQTPKQNLYIRFEWKYGRLEHKYSFLSSKQLHLEL